eukprot:UN27943
MFGTVYSGYTVVGVPEETFRYGFFSYRWLFTILPMVILMAWLGGRLQFLGHKRNYVSPTDYIKDRYNSHTLRALISCDLALAAVIYVLAQFKTMGSTIEALSDGEIDSMWASFILCIIMLIYEVFGGLRAIAWTDCIQASVLVCGFMLFYGVQEELFGGVEQAGKTMNEIGLGTLLSESSIQSWLGFGMTMFFAYPMYPQMIQRYQSAATPETLKKSMIFYFLEHGWQ